MKSTCAIAGRMVGKGHPCYVIAEAGVNHNCDVRLGYRLVETAHEAGADAIRRERVLRAVSGRASVTVDRGAVHGVVATVCKRRSDRRR